MRSHRLVVLVFGWFLAPLCSLAQEAHVAAPSPAGLTRTEAEAAVAAQWKAHRAEREAVCLAELQTRVLTAGKLRFRWRERRFGKAPPAGHALWISLHGGGGAPARVNDQQWRNQIRLYEPAEGIYVAPRAPTDTWNLWHQAHVDDFLARLIEVYAVGEGIDLNRVYVMGYSAGGDGVYQLAPRIADRFAAAAMMAGHPNETHPDGLRNLPFALFMGGEDGAYRRNAVAREWKQKLAALREADPEGYPHLVRIYPGLGHWMKRKDREALPWMARRSRRSWPRRVVWLQDDVTHERFYWLARPKSEAKRGQRIVAEVEGQTIRLREAEGVESLRVLLRDDLLDLDRAVCVLHGQRKLFEGRVTRTAAAIASSLRARPDPHLAAFAVLDLDLAAPPAKGD